MPDFFIVGAPKCGTTAMYAYLRQHPQIFMPFHKEPHFFGSDLTRRYGHITAEDYGALFRPAGPDQLAGEASTWYLYSATAAEEIARAVPDAKIIVMLRNPVDVMYAQHSQLLFNRQEDVTDFAEALALEPDRRAGLRLPPGPVRRENLFYRAMVGFSDQVSRYFDVFGRGRVHIIIHDDFREDGLRVYRDTLEFLGVDPHFRADLAPINENKRVRSARLQQLVFNPPLLRRLIPVLRRFAVIHRARDLVLEANSRRAARRPLDAALRRRLEHDLEPEVRRLGALLGRDLSGWTAHAEATLSDPLAARWTI